MTAVTSLSSPSAGLWDQYRDNLSRHLIGLSRYVQTGMMNTLQGECGHNDLRLGFAPYIMLIDNCGRRLSELADTLGISRQACNQAIKQIESAGYVARESDPQDGRAKQLVLTEAGRQLRRDGARVVRGFDRQFSDILGAEEFARTAQTLGKIHQHLELGLRGGNVPAIPYEGLGGLLPRLSDYTLLRIMELTRDRGHPNLKLSFGQVLTLIGPSGGRIQQMAAIQDVSKQAISAIVVELEELGYLRREVDPADARQILLYFTDKGESLIADSVASVDELEREFADIAGKNAAAHLNKTLRSLYHGLRLEHYVFESGETSDLPRLARQLREQLGEEGCQTLARLLMNPASELR